MLDDLNPIILGVNNMVVEKNTDVRLTQTLSDDGVGSVVDQAQYLMGLKDMLIRPEIGDPRTEVGPKLAQQEGLDLMG